MDGLVEYIHFGTIALSAAINAVGVGIGQGLSSSAAVESINRQPAARNEIMKTAILGMALIETAAVMGTFVEPFWVPISKVASKHIRGRAKPALGA